MKLKDNFFVIDSVEESNENFIYKIKFNISHEILKSHFPKHPIVPGVYMLQILKEIISEKNKNQYIISQIKTMKFINPINPIEDSNITISFKIDEVGNNFSVSANFQNENKTKIFSKTKILLSVS